jgi:hypothetical protein
VVGDCPVDRLALQVHALQRQDCADHPLVGAPAHEDAARRTGS